MLGARWREGMSLPWRLSTTRDRARSQEGWMALACGHGGAVGGCHPQHEAGIPGARPLPEVLEQPVFCATRGSSC